MRATGKNKILLGLGLLFLVVLIITTVRFVNLVTENNTEVKEQDEINNEEILDDDGEDNNLVDNGDLLIIKDDIEISHMDHSIYNETEPEIIATRFADALGESPIKSYKTEYCCGGERRMKYDLQNDNHFIIELYELTKTHTIIERMSLLKSSFHDNNGTYDIIYAENHVLEIVTNFLIKFGADLENYSMKITPTKYDEGWDVNIYQLYNNSKLNYTGFHAFVSKDNGEIRTMIIKDWYKTESQIHKNITINEGAESIYNELKESGFNFTVPYHEDYYNEENNTSVGTSWDVHHIIVINQTDIEFTGYSLRWGRLAYNYEINLKINATKSCLYQYIINIEDGKKLFWKTQSGNSSSVKYYFDNLL